MIEVSLQAVVAAAVPLKETVENRFAAPNPVPVITTGVPGSPEVGSIPLIDGVGVTVNATPLLTWPPTVTSTRPVVAPAGTVAVIEVSLQAVVAAAVPLKVTVEVPFAAPKLRPVMVTGTPAPADVGSNWSIHGAAAPSGSSSPSVSAQLPPM